LTANAAAWHMQLLLMLHKIALKEPFLTSTGNRPWR